MFRRAGPTCTRIAPHVLLASAACWATCSLGGEPPASPWHADVARARSAAVASQRPVLALFIASWSPESRATGAVLQASPEVSAAVAAHFEPVVVDAAVDYEFARRVGVSHIPTAVVLGAGDRVLVSFECPAGVPAFVAAVKRASDQAAAVGMPTAVAEVGSRTPAAGSQEGAVALLTAKVRNLSTFAGTPATATVAASRPMDLQDSFGSGPTTSPGPGMSPGPMGSPSEPALPRVPPAWHAERPVAPLAFATPTSPPTRSTIEPALHSPQPTPHPVATTAPWLQAAEAVAPDSSASVSDLPAPSAAPQAAAPRTASAWSWPKLRNPFAKPDRKPEPQMAQPAPIPTMPPARPQWPGTVAATVPQQPPVTTPGTAPAAVPTPGQQPFPARPPVAAVTPGQPVADSMPLGLEGYCPVTLAEKQAWAEGRPQYGARHRGRTYLFAGPEQQRTFLADPDRYAPALSGDDPVLAFDQGRSMPGQRRYGVVCQSRMYLFASPETCEAFKANPERYAGRVAFAEQTGVHGTRTY